MTQGVRAPGVGMIPFTTPGQGDACGMTRQTTAVAAFEGVTHTLLHTLGLGGAGVVTLHGRA